MISDQYRVVEGADRGRWHRLARPAFDPLAASVIITPPPRPLRGSGPGVRDRLGEGGKSIAAQEQGVGFIFCSVTTKAISQSIKNVKDFSLKLPVQVFSDRQFLRYAPRMPFTETHQISMCILHRTRTELSESTLVTWPS